MKAVSIEAVQKSYGPTRVLKGIDLEINAGEFVVLLGPSGCGKSTLLHAIAGLDDIDDGDIKIGGQSVLDQEPKDRGIAMVFQSYALYPTMTVKQNLSFGLRMNHVKSAEIEHRVMKAAAMLQIVELLDRKPANLSGGQRQRVAIGRALVRDVAVFLFDEPLSNLDAKLRTEMRLELKRLHDILGATMIYVTHDQVEAMTMANRIAVLRAGTLEQFATPQVIYDQPANLFVASFVGSPEINKFEGSLRRRRDGVHFVEVGQVVFDLGGYAFLNPPVVDQRVVLSIRAENLIPHSDSRKFTHGRLFEVRPALCEPLGSETLVWCDSLVGRVCVKLRPDQCVDLPEKMTVGFDPDHISLFDAETTKRL